MNNNFYKLLTGRTLTNIGDSLFMIGVPLYLYQISNSSDLIFMLNFVLILGGLLAPLLGRYIDTANKKLLIVVLQMIQLVCMGITYALVASYHLIPTYGYTLLICLFIGVFLMANTSTYLVQQALIPFLVPEQHWPTANKYMQMAYSTINIVADALAALLITFTSIIILASTSVGFYLLSIAVFLWIRLKSSTNYASPNTVLNEESHEDCKEETFKNKWQALRKNNLYKPLTYIFIISFLFQVLFQFITTYSVVYFTDLDKEYLYPILSLMLFLGMLIGNIMSDQLKNHKSINMILIITNICWICIALFTKCTALLFGGIVLISLTSGILEPIMMTRFQSTLQENIGSGLSILLAFNSLGKLISMPIIYVLYKFYYFRGIFAGTAIIIFLISMVCIFKITLSSSPQKQDPSDCNNVMP